MLEERGDKSAILWEVDADPPLLVQQQARLRPDLHQPSEVGRAHGSLQAGQCAVTASPRTGSHPWNTSAKPVNRTVGYSRPSVSSDRRRRSCAVASAASLPSTKARIWSRACPRESGGSESVRSVASRSSSDDPGPRATGSLSRWIHTLLSGSCLIGQGSILQSPASDRKIALISTAPCGFRTLASSLSWSLVAPPA